MNTTTRIATAALALAGVSATITGSAATAAPTTQGPVSDAAPWQPGYREHILTATGPASLTLDLASEADLAGMQRVTGTTAWVCPNSSAPGGFGDPAHDATRMTQPCWTQAGSITITRSSLRLAPLGCCDGTPINVEFRSNGELIGVLTEWIRATP